VVVDVGRETLLDHPPRLREAGAASSPHPAPIADSDAVALMGAFLHRNPAPLSDGWAFPRSPESSDSVIANIRALTAWLQSAPPDEIKEMLSDGAPYAYLSQESKMLFARLCFNQGVQKRMASGELSVVDLRLSFVGHCVDPHGKERDLYLDAFSQFTSAGQAGLNRVSSSYVRPQIDLPTRERRPVAPLDFTHGALLTVAELAGRASDALQMRFDFDTRLAKQYVYVQGSFSATTFLEYMRPICRTFDCNLDGATTEQVRSELESVVRQVVPPLLDPKRAPREVGFRDLLAGRTFALRNLLAAFPYYKGNESLKLPEDTPVTLVPALRVEISGAPGGDIEPEDPPGTSPTGISWITTYRFHD
jgi:hypothetical protein